MPRYDAVVFDWSGTLVHDPPLRDRVAATLARLGRSDASDVVGICTALERCAADPDVLAAQAGADTSRAAYQAAESLHFERAGLDDELAICLMRFDEYAESRPLYRDVLPVMEQLRGIGCRVIILSDIHFDIRPLLRAQGVGPFIDDYVLSYEHGVQKPDPRIFELALGRSGLSRDRMLMVGDRSTHDGAATESGITTLLLPPLELFGPRGLSLVTALARDE